MKLDKRFVEMMYDGFVKCPNTGKILEVLKGDDKVICYCGKSAPGEPEGYNERTHTHIVRVLERRGFNATAEEFIEQEEHPPPED